MDKVYKQSIHSKRNQKASKYFKINSVISEMQSKTMRYHFIPIRLVKIKNNFKDMKECIYLYTTSGSALLN